MSNLVLIWSLPPKGGTLNDQINPFSVFRRKILLPPLGGSWAGAGCLERSHLNSIQLLEFLFELFLSFLNRAHEPPDELSAQAALPADGYFVLIRMHEES